MPDIQVAAHKSDGAKSMKNVKYGWLIFALIMLFNPNLHLIDILPDFIGFFILAKFIERAADAAPYFEEARAAFVKLGYISLAKIPALFVIVLVRSKNTLDNDIIALFALVFTTVELLYLFPAIKNMFDALTYLGERGRVPTLIKGDTLISTDALRSFTFVFATLKCSLYTLPEFLKLTKSVDIGSTTSILMGSRLYPLAVLAAQSLVLIIGSVWLFRMMIFARRIKKDGTFYSAIEEIATVNSYEEYEKKVHNRFVNRVFLYFILSAIFSFDLTFSDYNDINLLPSFISGIFFAFGVLGLIKCIGDKKMRTIAIVTALLYNAAALVKYIFEIKFLDKFNYADLFRHYSETANAEYRKIEIFAVVEFIFYIALTVIFFLSMKKYTDTKLGRWREDSNPNVKAQYYREINVKTVILTVICFLVGLVSFANVFVQGSVKIVFTDSSNVTKPALFVPHLPWFGLVIAVFSIVFSFYSVYYFNFIKDEERV